MDLFFILLVLLVVTRAFGEVAERIGQPSLVGELIAGIVLGTLAMKTRSIWSGFLIHVSVAVSMDVAALLQTTGMPSTFWPDL